MEGDIYFINGVGDNSEWVDITSDEFTNNPHFTKYLRSKLITRVQETRASSFPKIWVAGGDIQPLPKGKFHSATYWGGMKTTSGWYDGYPEKFLLNYRVHNFRVYVSNRSYFLSRLPPLKITTSSGKSVWSDKEDYYRVVFATYCASYCCGVSMQHLTPSDDVHPVITTVMRFHLYFTIRRLIRMERV